MKKFNYYVISFVLLAISLIFDKQIILLITGLRINFLNTLMIALAYISTELVLFLFVTIILLISKKYKEIPIAWLSLIISLLITFTLKWIVARPRPFETLQIEPLFISSNSSFPSGHATAAFSALAIFDFYIKKYKLIWCIFAILILLNRLYIGVHYLSDVIAGSLIGYITASLIIYFYKQKVK